MAKKMKPKSSKKPVKKAKKSKLTEISVWMDGDVLDFYRQVGKFARVSEEKAMLVVIAIEVLKMKREGLLDNPNADRK
jgi:hypothetical protein